MRVAARLAWDEIGWGAPLARALGAGTLPEELRAPDLLDLQRVAARAAGDAAALPALAREHGDTPPWRALCEPRALAVVTGQQPGCAGGPLLVLYKAATAVALARRAARALCRPVVPLYWNAADDDDFDEVARVAWPDISRGLLFFELPREDRRAGGWVGDLPAAGDAAAAEAALALVAPPQRDPLRALLPDRASDHAGWVSELLQRTFPELAVLDARSPALRRAGAPLFARYLEELEAVRRAATAGEEAVLRAGGTGQLRAAVERLALFHTEERRRRKTGTDAAPLRAALARAPETLSPGVLLRPLLQDSVLPTLAHVVGPAEIAYLLELRPVRRTLAVHEPALVPRLGATILAEAAWDAASRLALPARALVQDPEGALRAAASMRVRAHRERATAAVDACGAALTTLPLAEPAQNRAAKRLAALGAELDAALLDRARSDLLAEDPALAALAALRPRGEPQERIVAGLWLLAAWGEASRERLVTLAEEHLAALGERRGEHPLVVARIAA